jgi:ankyrin repeat protein
VHCHLRRSCALTAPRFLLARLHVDSLLDKRTPKDVKTSLANLTKGAAALDVAYTEALQRIEGQLEGDRELAKRVLSWITFAKRPLTTTEICCALAVEPEETKIDPDNIPDSDDIVSVCAGLIVVDHESAIVRLVHYTTQEYFERTGDAWVLDGQLHIARTCLTYLCFDAFQSGSCSADEEYGKRLQEHQFLDYAAKHWGEHARKVEDDIAGQVWEFLNSTSLSCAAQVMRAPVYKYKGYSKQDTTTTPLHELAHFGLAIVAGKIVSAPELIAVMANAKDNRGDPPLSLAARQGHCEMVKKLLETGADINGYGKHYGSALQIASFIGHTQVVKTLLDKGADINVQGGHFSSALQAASAGGHKQVVKVLLDKGADVNARGGSYGNAMHASAYGGHTEMLDLLITNCGISQLQDYYGRTLLWWAAAGGNTATIEALIHKHNMDPQTADNLGRRPFWIASKKGHSAASKLLQAYVREPNTSPTAPPNGNHNQPSLECDVCTSHISENDACYHCNLCAAGDWDICEDCRRCGATCLETAHVLVKWAKLNGVWSETTS